MGKGKLIILLMALLLLVTIPAYAANPQNTEMVFGDADGDSHVDAYDASMIKKYSVGALTADSLRLIALDLDGDDHVDAYDASLIQKYSVGAIDRFPVESIVHTHSLVHVSAKEATNMAPGNIEYWHCSACGKYFSDAAGTDVITLEDTVVPFVAFSESTPTTLKILTIGNSFSTDTMEHLYQIAENAGVKTIVLGNLYVGGCSLEQHISYGKNGTAAYTYWENTTGTWVKNTSKTMAYGIAAQDWDYISIQETSKTCGLESSYTTNLPAMIDLVRTMNTDAKLIFNMTWAYQQDSDHASFPNYNNDQMTMYNMIINCVNKCISPQEELEIIVPNMTAIQNARTSFLGDTLTRDGYHLNTNIGRYIAALTMYAAVTNAPIDHITCVPDANFMDSTMLAIAKESVTNAINTPLSVTTSRYAASTDADIAEIYGVDLGGYVQIDWSYLTNSYWNCGSKTTVTTPTSTSNENYNMFVCSDAMWSIEDLPEGTVFIMDHNWQNRLQIWQTNTAAYSGSNRPAKSGVPFIKLSDVLDGCQYVAWNLTYLDKRYTHDKDSDMSSLFDEAYKHLRIYVPAGDKQIAAQNGVDLSGYTLLQWDYLQNSYWKCNSSTTVTTPGSSASTYNQNVCSSKRWSVSDLPEGTVFILDSGWQYRLEIWDSETEANATRPGMTTDAFYVLDSSLLGNSRYIAWNISSNPKTDISANFNAAASHLRIYIPND